MLKFIPLLVALLFITSCNREDKKLPQEVSTVDQESVNPPSENPLMELDWLIGGWADEEKAIDLKSNYRFDGEKKFILQHFLYQPEEGNSFQGEQIIGWDPDRKIIRSWIFDSDGGFGESLWNQRDDNVWYVTTSYTLPNGQKATALHIYEKIDKNHYTFSSQNRDIDGVFLPNIGPYKVARYP